MASQCACVFLFKQTTAYGMRISDWSSDVCSSDRAFGAKVEIKAHGQGGLAIHLTGEPELTPCPIIVPGDPSSAAFPVVAALIVPGSDIIVEGITLNPHRAGLYTTLIEMGGDIEVINQRDARSEAHTSELQ